MPERMEIQFSENTAIDNVVILKNFRINIIDLICCNQLVIAGLEGLSLYVVFILFFEYDKLTTLHR